MFIIGERINPAGKPELVRAIREEKKEFIQKEAQAQERAGAQALDINVYLPDLDRARAMKWAAETIRSVSQLPLVMDDRDPAVVESGLKAARENSWINSPVDLDGDHEKILSLAKQFNAQLLTLPMKQNRISWNPKEHIAISKLLLERFENFGISRQNIVIDAMVLALKQAKEKVMDTLETLKGLKEELGVRTLLALSNVSYGLKNREELNARFLKLTRECGIDFVICDPLQKKVMAVAKAEPEVSGHLENRKFLEFAETCR
ncbi:MAG: hypothetical protein A3A81_03020 [Omnitrophica bacterium RIFCSPLOWO2_01_FULL_45_10b]|nr:MAG: hypothetical protein A3A81_03020 [Omnitrophica bacterium RIFCSPLOWO2_01_FULL_45_10b]